LKNSQPFWKNCHKSSGDFFTHTLGLGFSGSADLLVQLSNLKNPRWQLTKNGHNLAAGLPIHVVFGSKVGLPAELIFIP